MASSSIPFMPSPLSRDPRNNMAPPVAAGSMGAPTYINNAQPVYLQQDGTTIPSFAFEDPTASSSRSRLRQPFQPYTGPTGHIFNTGGDNINNNNNPNPINNSSSSSNNNNNNVYYTPSTGFNPFAFSGSVPFVPPPPATGPCPLAQPVDIGSLATPGLEATGNDTSVTASPTSPTAGSTQSAMYSASYFTNGGASGYVHIPQQPIGNSWNSGEASKVSINLTNSGWATEASDWEDHGDSHMSIQRPPAYGVPKQVMATWAPQPSPHFATPSSSTGSPASPPHHAHHISPLAHPAHPERKTAATIAAKVPRPPNAWILYRSEMLNQIRNGQMPSGLEEIVPAQQGARSGSATSGSDGENKKKGKKGSKDNSAALIAQLGGGKAGRGLPQADISKMISLLWKKEPEEVRRKYEQMSELKKLEHQKLYPNYKFQPVRKEEKLAQRAERAKERDERRREKEIYRQRQRRRMRGRGTPGHEDEGHVVGVSMTRSNSFPPPDGQMPFQISYSAWGQGNIPEDSEGEAMQTSLAEPVVFDTSLLAMPQQYGMMPQMSQMMGAMNGQQISMTLPTATELPPSPQRSSGPPTLSSSHTDRGEWAAPPPAAYLAAQRNLITPPQDGANQAQMGNMSLQLKRDQSQALYVFQPPNIPPEMQVTDPEALAALWCKLEPEALEGANPSPANPTPNYAFPTLPVVQSIDNLSWDQHEPEGDSIQVPMSVASMIMADWQNLNPGGSGMTLTPAPNYQQQPADQNQSQGQSGSNFQRTLAPTPSFSNQVSPVDGNMNRDSPVRPSPWDFISTNAFGGQMATSVPRTVMAPYAAQNTVERESNMFGGRYTTELDGAFMNADNGNGDGSKDMLNLADMVGPPTGYPADIGGPNVSIGLPVSMSNVQVGPAPVPRMVRRPRQIGSKYETVAGAV